jgi:hypothetical protein
MRFSLGFALIGNAQLEEAIPGGMGGTEELHAR